MLLFPEEEEKKTATDFEAFWAVYPRKLAKSAARKAWDRARKKTPAAAILDGLKRYIRTKPAWQSYAHAATWLNGERWTDDLEPRLTARPPLVRVSVGTPQWQAWVKAGHKPTLVIYESRFGPDGGWFFKSEWPSVSEDPLQISGEQKSRGANQPLVPGATSTRIA